MPKNQLKKTEVEDIAFEEALARLEDVVDAMQSGDMPLEKIIESYEEGIKLLETCESKLQVASEKIELLTKDKSGKVIVSTLEGETTSQDKDEKEDEEARLF